MKTISTVNIIIRSEIRIEFQHQTLSPVANLKFMSLNSATVGSSCSWLE